LMQKQIQPNNKGHTHQDSNVVGKWRLWCKNKFNPTTKDTQTKTPMLLVNKDYDAKTNSTQQQRHTHQDSNVVGKWRLWCKNKFNPMSSWVGGSVFFLAPYPM
jgi:hypothetical protein